MLEKRKFGRVELRIFTCYRQPFPLRLTFIANPKVTRSELFGKAVWLSLRKIKREATQRTKSQHKVASHFILPQRSKPFFVATVSFNSISCCVKLFI
jgi:hypothetical protein